jgi:hypothetical protein
MNALFGFVVGLVVMFLVKDYLVKFYNAIIAWFKRIINKIKVLFSKEGE